MCYLLLVQGCNGQWHVQRCYGDLKVGCHLFLETGSIISIVPCLPLRLWISNKGFYRPWCVGTTQQKYLLVLISMYEATTKHLFMLCTRKILHMTGAGQFGNNSKAFFPLGCYDHSSLMESHLHRALFLVTGTVPFHFHCRAASGLKISSLSC